MAMRKATVLIVVKFYRLKELFSSSRLSRIRGTGTRQTKHLINFGKVIKKGQ